MKKQNVDLESLFVIEYSILQDTVHVHSLLDSIKKNRRNIGVNSSSDFVPVGVTETRAKADKIANQIRIKLEKVRKTKRFRGNWHSIVEILKKINPLSSIKIIDA